MCLKINTNQNNQNQQIQPQQGKQNNYVQNNGPSPEYIYCNAPIKNKTLCCRVRKHGVGKAGILVALKQIHEQYYDINYANMELRYNQLSRKSFEKNIITPLVNSSTLAPPEQIKQGKLVYCCNYFFQKLRKYSIFLLSIYAMTIFLQLVGYGLILHYYSLSTTSAAKELATPFIIQVSLWIGIFVFSTVGVFTSNMSLFKIMIICKRINLLYGIFVSVFGIDVGVRKSTYDNRQYVHIFISVLSMLLGITPVMICKAMVAKLRRFNILLSKVKQDDIDSGCCLFY